MKVAHLNSLHIGKEVEYYTPNGVRHGRLKVVEHRYDEVWINFDNEDKLTMAAPEWECRVTT